MKSRGALAVVACGLAGALAQPALAAETIFKEDAEGTVEAKWTANKPADPKIQPWQKSDSSTLKSHRNQAHGGMTSFWTGSSPQDFEAQTVVQGDSIIVTKASIQIPADGATTIAYWSYFQNEGDDVGRVDAAIAKDTPPAADDWQPVVTEVPPSTSVGDGNPNPMVCAPDKAETQMPVFHEAKGNFEAFAGQRVFLRFVMSYGGENRTTTQPCGWYIDDIAVNTTGTVGLAGAPPATTPPPAATPPPATAPPTTGSGGAPQGGIKVRFTGLKAKGRKATLGVNVTGNDLKKVSVKLLKGRKTVGKAKLASLKAGVGKVVFKLRKKLKKGSYKVSLTATALDGTKVKGSGKVRAK